MINYIEKFENNNTEYNLETKLNNSKPSIKSNFILTFLFFGLIIVSIVIAGFIGPNFLSFFMFYLLFGFPLMVIYRNEIIAMLPSNISNSLDSNIQSIDETVQEDIKSTTNIDTTPKKNKELFILFIGAMSFSISVYILYKRRDDFIGIGIALFFTILSNIIISDLF